MRLTVGSAAPDFTVTDLYGQTRSLADYRGRKLHLSFYRYASCPFCNLRVHEMRQKSALWQQQGMDLMAVFQSPVESIQEYAVGKVEEFPVIPDPQRKLYTLYGAETSWLAFAKSAGRLKDIAAATAKGFLPGKMEGEVNQVPAEFLIDENGIIRTAFYGKDIGDHLDIEIVERFASGR